LIAGRNNAVPTPARRASATVAANEWIRARATKQPARRRSAEIVSRRRETRSASDPKNGESAIPGKNSPSNTSEIAQPEWNR